MAAPQVIAAGISAGASLLGGLFNRNAQKKANEANRPVNQVAEWEAAGINPLFGISSGGYIPHQATSIGDSFATAGAQFADFIAGDKEQELRETQLELENEHLKKKLDGLVKPSEPGHLAQHGALLPLPSQGLSDGTPDQNPQVVSVGDGGIRHVDWAAPDRDVEVAPYTSGPGVTEINNAFTGGRPILVPGSDGEPWGIDEVITATAVGGPQYLAHMYSDYIGQPFADFVLSFGDEYDSTAVRKSKRPKARGDRQYDHEALVPDHF